MSDDKKNDKSTLNDDDKVAKSNQKGNTYHEENGVMDSNEGKEIILDKEFSNLKNVKILKKKSYQESDDENELITNSEDGEVQGDPSFNHYAVKSIYMSILGLFLSPLLIFQTIGLYFGIKGLKSEKKAIAIAGTLFNILNILIGLSLIILIVVGILLYSWSVPFLKEHNLYPF